MTTPSSMPTVYEGQFGTFTIDQADRRGIIIYRAGLMAAALTFAAGTGVALVLGNTPSAWQSLSVLYTLFWLSLGVSLWTIHIYLEPLHRALQVLWVIGGLSSLWIAHAYPDPFVLTVLNQPYSLFGVGFTFAALTGIYFKEAFCFNRLETKLLTPLVPVLLLSHLLGPPPLVWEQSLLGIWAVGFLVFAVRKALQPIPPDIGDKTVFAYLKQQRTEK